MREYDWAKGIEVDRVDQIPREVPDEPDKLRCCYVKETLESYVWHPDLKQWVLLIVPPKPAAGTFSVCPNCGFSSFNSGS
jgi:hypothetical protein